MRLRTLVRHWRPDFKREQYAAYLVGCSVFSFGAACFIASRLGTDRLDVFALAMVHHVGLTVGIAQGGFALLCLAVWSAWARRVPVISPFVTFFVCGSLIDALMYFDVAERLASRFGPTAAMLTGAALCAHGSSLIIASGIGVRAMDLVALLMAQRLGWPFWLNKGLMELSLLVVGRSLGGPIGVGTLVFLLMVGWCIQPLILLNERWLGIANHTPHTRGLHVTQAVCKRSTRSQAHDS